MELFNESFICSAESAVWDAEDWYRLLRFMPFIPCCIKYFVIYKLKILPNTLMPMVCPSVLSNVLAATAAPLLLYSTESWTMMIKAVPAPPNPIPIIKMYASTNSIGESIPSVDSNNVLIIKMALDVSVTAFPPYLTNNFPRTNETIIQESDIGSIANPAAVGRYP